MKPFQPFFRGRRHVRGKLRSSAFRRGFDHPSIIILSRSSFHLARKKKIGYCRGTVVLHTQYRARVTNVGWLHEFLGHRNHNYVPCNHALSNCDRRTDCMFPLFESRLESAQARKLAWLVAIEMVCFWIKGIFSWCC